MSALARLVFPSLRWRRTTGFDHERAKIDAAQRAGVGGYILFGGDREPVRQLVNALRADAAHPLLIASDLERGAGQQFDGLTPLPPPGALGFVRDVEITARCGAVTAAEALSVGVNWIYAPVADLDRAPNNPIVQTRSFGDDPPDVARQVAAWIGAAERAGAVTCAKHFPGHGRTTADSHETLPHVATPLMELSETDLGPFRAAIRAGTRSLMTAHVAYDAWDQSGRPATLSPPILDYARREMGFEGLIVTDAMIMEGMLRGTSEAAAATDAIAAGCDALLYPRDIDGVIAALDRRGAADPNWRRRAERAAGRVHAVSAEATPAAAPVAPAAAHRAFADAVADLAMHALRGERLDVEPPVAVHIVDDDVGGPYGVGPRDRFERALRDAGVEIASGGASVVLVYAEPRSWKGRADLGERSLGQLARLLSTARLVVLFGHPRLMSQIGGDVPVVCAWHGQELMQEAAARWVLARGLDG